MSDIAIRVENLGKKYTLGGQKSGSFRESITNLFSRDAKPKTQNPNTTDFWALKDINFEIKRGEAVGIIGRNGAGKSTLLKILSRITEPTKGRFEVFGRVSSLLEVGTGFHPELTGRENVYLNGTILGMKRAEVKAKFDEIVAFSGVEKFIDTPVKHYSSGMQVRLAFAVAAHLEPEILIIDEVLAVGDAEFQKKCLGKMEDVTGEGRTVLFVSHNMQAVKNLCSRGIFLSDSNVVADDSTDLVIEKYLSSSSLNKSRTTIEERIDPDFQFKDFEILQYDKQVDVVQNDVPLKLTFTFQLHKKIKGLRLRLDVVDSQHSILFRSHQDDGLNDFSSSETNMGIHKAEILFPANLFITGRYYFVIYASIYGVRTFEPKDGVTIPLDVTETGLILRSRYPSTERGSLTIPLSWKLGNVEYANSN